MRSELGQRIVESRGRAGLVDVEDDLALVVEV